MEPPGLDSAPVATERIDLQFAGLGVRATSPESKFVQSLHATFPHQHGAGNLRAVDAHIEADPAAEEPRTADLRGKTAFYRSEEARAYNVGDMLEVLMRKSWWRLDPGQGTVLGTLFESATTTRDNMRYNACFAFPFIAFELLRGHGLVYLHASCAVDPEGRTVLVPAIAHAGKTTIACALAAAGWRLAGDDAVWVDLRGERPAIRGLRKRLHIDPELIGRIPGLEILRNRQTYVDGNPKREADDRELWRDGWTDNAPAPSLVVFPEIADAATTEVRPLTDADMLARLLAIAPPHRVINTRAREHLQGFSELLRLRGAHGIRFVAGRDVFDRPERYAELFTRAMEDA